MKDITIYPFTAIVGQEYMKKALLLNTIYPAIGGVLIRGEKGTAKSTSVRALAQLLPHRDVVKGCACGCSWNNPDAFCPDCMDRKNANSLEKENVPMSVVELPLGSTEDRVVGTLDIEHAISTGKKKFEPGILAKANGNILYIDEVNLLDDHIVDLLLDAAAMGVNFIEREGVSYRHASKFVLIGTMNPEEGDLRPQLLDRFGLMVDVKGEYNESSRNEIIRRRLEFERDPDCFCEKYEPENSRLREKILEARKIIGSMIPGDRVLDAAVKIAMHVGVDGHRADLTLVKAACANAALDGREQAVPEDVAEVTNMVLKHRMRRNPFQDSTLDSEGLESWISDILKTI